MPPKVPASRVSNAVGGRRAGLGIFDRGRFRLLLREDTVVNAAGSVSAASPNEARSVTLSCSAGTGAGRGGGEDGENIVHESHIQ